MRFRIRGKMFHSFDPRMLRRGWKGGMIHEPAGFLMFILCGIAPLYPLAAHFGHKWLGDTNMLDVPATRTREEYNFAGATHYHENRRGDASDIGFIYEYHYADGSMEYKFDYPTDELVKQESDKRRQQS